MKILLLILGLFFSGGLFAEPSDWVQKQLIDKPISYMTYGLYRCTENFAKNQSDTSPPTCNYDYVENRLIFLQTDTSVQETFSSTDINEALQYCKDNLTFVLESFTKGRDWMFYILYLNGFSPDGYGYVDDPDRKQKLQEFTRRGLVRYQIIHKETNAENTVWLCEWKFNQPEPSIRKSPPL